MLGKFIKTMTFKTLEWFMYEICNTLAFPIRILDLLVNQTLHLMWLQGFYNNNNKNNNPTYRTTKFPDMFIVSIIDSRFFCFLLLPHHECSRHFSQQGVVLIIYYDSFKSNKKNVY